MIDYTWVSEAAILRDWIELNIYVNNEHKLLTDIADSLYNVGSSMVDRFTNEYKTLYNKYGKEYFDRVLDDMSALDSQVISDSKAQELIDDYLQRVSELDPDNVGLYDSFYDNDDNYYTGEIESYKKEAYKKESVTNDLDIDMWYGDEFVPKKYGADAYFNDLESYYWGWIYDDSGKKIGDYTTTDSTAVSKNFQIAWNESYVRESFDDDWTVSTTSQFYDGERHTLRKYTRELNGHKVLVYPKYNEKLDQIDWTVFLDGEKKEVFETSYDAIDFVDYEAADLYL